MSDWDLLMPGAGLTAIGAVGVAIALSGISKTFMDGMQSVSILCMFFGLIFLTAGLFKDGFPKSKKAKVSSGVILTLFVAAGIIGAFQVSDRVPTIYSYIAILIIISVPTVVIIIASFKKIKYFAKISTACIVVIVVGSGVIISTTWFTAPATAGTEDLQQTESGAEETAIPNVINATIFAATIPPGASGQGNPSYDPAVIEVKKGDAIEWTNLDNVPHTVTSLEDDGESFDSGIFMIDEKYVLDTSTLSNSEYEYFCTLHPYMKAQIVLN